MQEWFYREHFGPGRRGGRSKRQRMGTNQAGDSYRDKALPGLLEGDSEEEEGDEDEDEENEVYEDEHGVNDGALWAPDEDSENEEDDHHEGGDDARSQETKSISNEHDDTSPNAVGVKRKKRGDGDALSIGSSDSQPYYKNIRKGLEYVRGKRRTIKNKKPDIIRRPKYMDLSDVDSADSVSTHSSFTESGPFKKVKQRKT
jgi:hypothetical protein